VWHQQGTENPDSATDSRSNNPTTQQPNSPTGRLAGILLSIWLSISRRKDRRHYEAIKLDGSGNIFEGKYNLNLL